jgi:hypothetical protein
MNIYWIQQFWFNDHYNSTSNVERYYLDIKDFGTRNVAVSCALNVLGPGANIAINNGNITGNVGYAAVGIKWYEFIDDQGHFQHIDNDYFVPCILIRNCVAVRIELALSLAWVGATGTVHYFNA